MMKSSISSMLITVTALTATSPVVQSTPSRIVGGKQSTINDFPYFVDVGGCGGALIAPDAVLLAAHCDDRSNHQVIVGSFESGSLDYKEGSETQKSEARFCETWVPHPDYEGENNDFALCRLNKAVNLDTSRTRLEWNFESSILNNGEDLIVMGTGLTTEDGESATLLHDVTVHYIPNDECKTSYGILTDNMLCAGLKEGGKDSCQGDSGGPIVKRVVQPDNTFIDYHVGVVSFGTGCARANKPGVYARTSAAKTWIEDTLQAWSNAPPAPCDGIEIDVSLSTDTYGYETRWSIREQGSNDEADDIFSRTYLVPNYVNDHKVCIAKSKCYTFEITDEYGDGMCPPGDKCGNYKASVRGKQMFESKGDFKKSEQKGFCIESNGEQVDELTRNSIISKKQRRKERRKQRKNSKTNKGSSRRV